MNRRDFLKRAAAGPLLALPGCRNALQRRRSESAQEMSVFLGAREFEIGANRVPMALYARNNKAIEGARGTVRLEGAGTETVEAGLRMRTFLDAPVERPNPDIPSVFETPFFYDCVMDLPTAGIWELEVDVEANGTKYRGKAAIEIRDRRSPGPGDPAIAVKTPTDADPAGVAFVCTRDPACGMHAISLEDALASGKPTVLVVATPRFCTSRLCGPVVDEVMAVRDRHAANANFVHAEVYRDENASEYAPIMTEWKLETEPWVYIVDGRGTIRHGFEGPITFPQIEEALTST